MLHPLTGCYRFLGRNRQIPQSYHTPPKLSFPPVSQFLKQSPKVTHCLLLKVTHRLPGKETYSLSLKVADSLLEVTHCLLLKVTHRLPGKETYSLSLKVADSLLEVTHCLLLKVTYHQSSKVAHCLPLKRRSPWQWQVSERGNNGC